MFKKCMLYTCIGLIGLQPCAQAYAQSGYYDAVAETVEIVISEGEKIVVPLTSAIVNIGDACVNGVIAGGRILWVTTKLGAKCAYVLSEGCLYLARFSGEHPQFVTGLAVGVGAAYIISEWKRREANYYRQNRDREIRGTVRVARGL